MRFVGLDPAIQRRLAEFSEEGFAPGPEPSPLQHFEYRVVDAAAIVPDELNQLGLDGWQLSAALPAGKAFRLIWCGGSSQFSRLLTCVSLRRSRLRDSIEAGVRFYPVRPSRFLDLSSSSMDERR